MSNTIKNELCNYGFYANLDGLDADICEKDCNKIGTKTFGYGDSSLYFCDEHHALVEKNQQ